MGSQMLESTTKRIELESAQLRPTFIGSWMIDAPALCDELIVYFEERVAKQKVGVTSTGMDLSIKDRVDITIAPNELHLPGHEALEAYIGSLHKCYADYLVQWPFLENMGANLEIGKFVMANKL